MIDSHCHLDHEPMYNDLKNIILRSKEAGIKKILSICTTKNSFKKIIEIIQFDSIIYGTYGIHPHETDIDKVSKKEIIENVASNKKIIAIGESGLDFYYNHSSRDQQISSFKYHIEASIELNVPIIVHSRNAEKETFDILSIYKSEKPKILMHCFTGSSEFAYKLLTLDSYFSASGIITFKNSEDLRNTFKNIPNNKLLIETDSPYLSPVPFRGKKNEPSFIKYTLEKLAEIKGNEADNIKKITNNNFNTLFNLN
jgi:TatD DNase family protein|tara:strand:- start:133 stop:897 length:765 start_codon:yes stop_codon:yes gene_type:complete